MLAATVALSFAVDAIAVPRAPLRRPLLSSVLHILSVVFLLDLVFAVTSRPLFSACASLALVGLVAAVSNAKYESLREPFVFTDLSLFSQLFSHPRLYLPFLSVGKVVAIGAGIVLVVAGFIVERPVLSSSRALAWLAVVLLFMLAVNVAARVPLTLDPDADQHRCGFFAVFVAYLLNGLRPATFRRFREVMAAGPFTTGEPTRRPDVIMIQSESFFDARRLGEAVEPSLFARFDDACREAVWHGEMTVPAWGANTMRTEFAVLTGTESFSLGYARFYPYAFVRSKMASLASWFDRCGYDTVAIHPYYADFFGRNRVFPLLGFARFLDIRHFASASRAGPYVADAAVSESIIAELKAAKGGERPRFVFAMTMENHGPLHLEQVLPGESSSRHTLGEDASWRDLTAYLRHVENADAMIGRLIDYLRTSNRETVVCFYGDHVPALPHVFHRMGVTPQRSDYFIWRNYGTVAAKRRHLAAEGLGAVLLRVIQESGNRTEEPFASEKAT
ncbi:capsular biosynthesis protein [Burkholderia sp. MSMB617WGS]|uniref:LTA synthase family protein n=1 Tax=Burkholderia sp. MSMB617WGS TaxID=1637831 RepID=UPI00075FD529|nr:LTA synthase family protein [Burkholderia sp. MSMB617WGS]AOK46147.1 capsular biosynthesis protein [Burkholderia sp. MSMB617WGS]